MAIGVSGAQVLRQPSTLEVRMHVHNTKQPDRQLQRGINRHHGPQSEDGRVSRRRGRSDH